MEQQWLLHGKEAGRTESCFQLLNDAPTKMLHTCCNLLYTTKSQDFAVRSNTMHVISHSSCPMTPVLHSHRAEQLSLLDPLVPASLFFFSSWRVTSRTQPSATSQGMLNIMAKTSQSLSFSAQLDWWTSTMSTSLISLYMRLSTLQLHVRLARSRAKTILSRYA